MAKKKAAKRSTSKPGTAAGKSRPGALQARSVKSNAASSVRGGASLAAATDPATQQWKLNTWRPTSSG